MVLCVCWGGGGRGEQRRRVEEEGRKVAWLLHGKAPEGLQGRVKEEAGRRTGLGLVKRPPPCFDIFVYPSACRVLLQSLLHA